MTITKDMIVGYKNKSSELDLLSNRILNLIRNRVTELRGIQSDAMERMGVDPFFTQVSDFDVTNKNEIVVLFQDPYDNDGEWINFGTDFLEKSYLDNFKRTVEDKERQRLEDEARRKAEEEQAREDREKALYLKLKMKYEGSGHNER